MNNLQDYADKMNQLEKELAQIPDQFTLAPQQDEDTEESQSKSEEEKNSEDEENSDLNHDEEEEDYWSSFLIQWGHENCHIWF